MINASSEFINKLNNGGRCVNYADITLADGTILNLTPADFMTTGNSMTDSTSSNGFEIGSVIGKTCTLTIANHKGQFSGYDFYKSIIYLYVAMELDDGSIEKIRKGKFYSIEPSTAGDTITITGVDSIHLFDKPYDDALEYPTSLQAIVVDACLKCGVNMGNTEFPNYQTRIQNKPEDTTYRQVLTWVAQMAGGFFRMSPLDHLEYAWYPEELPIKEIIDGGDTYDRTNPETIDGGNFLNYEAERIIDGGDFFDYTDDDGYTHISSVSTLATSTDDIRITGIVIMQDKEKKVFGDETYAILIKDNPLIENHEDEIGEYLENKLVGIHFRPLTATVLNNPLYEPVDVMYIHDYKGNQYFTYINEVSYTTGGYTQLTCNAQEPIKNGSSYYSSVASELVQVKKDTDKKLSIYDQAVQNMNMLAMNSLGVFTSDEELEDGSRIYYMHNKPTREDSRIIYKMTNEGFFVSTDGGETYSAGFDAEGNAVLNVLSVIGITFDWAKGGSLSVGGINNDNGRILIFDEYNNQVGQIDNAGLAFYSATTKTQFILSPIFGLIQRDADGNEYNGFIYDDKVVWDKPSEQLSSFSNYTISQTHYMNVTAENSIVRDTVVGWESYRQYRYTATDNTASWILSTGGDYQNYSEKTILLPERFWGKDWLVLFIDEGLEEDIGNTKFYINRNYLSSNKAIKYTGSFVDPYYTFWDNWLSQNHSDPYLGRKPFYDGTTGPVSETYGSYDTSFNVHPDARTEIYTHFSKSEIPTMTPNYGEIIKTDITDRVRQSYLRNIDNGLVNRIAPTWSVADDAKTTLKITLSHKMLTDFIIGAGGYPSYVPTYARVDISFLTKWRIIVSC